MVRHPSVHLPTVVGTPKSCTSFYLTPPEDSDGDSNVDDNDDYPSDRSSIMAALDIDTSPAVLFAAPQALPDAPLTVAPTEDQQDNVPTALSLQRLQPLRRQTRDTDPAPTPATLSPSTTKPRSLFRRLTKMIRLPTSSTSLPTAPSNDTRNHPSASPRSSFTSREAALRERGLTPAASPPRNSKESRESKDSSVQERDMDEEVGVCAASAADATREGVDGAVTDAKKVQQEWEEKNKNSNENEAKETSSAGIADSGKPRSLASQNADLGIPRDDSSAVATEDGPAADARSCDHPAKAIEVEPQSATACHTETRLFADGSRASAVVTAKLGTMEGTRDDVPACSLREAEGAGKGTRIHQPREKTGKGAGSTSAPLSPTPAAGLPSSVSTASGALAPGHTLASAWMAAVARWSDSGAGAGAIPDARTFSTSMAAAAVETPADAQATRTATDDADGPRKEEKLEKHEKQAEMAPASELGSLNGAAAGPRPPASASRSLSVPVPSEGGEATRTNTGAAVRSSTDPPTLTQGPGGAQRSPKPSALTWALEAVDAGQRRRHQTSSSSGSAAEMVESPTSTTAATSVSGGLDEAGGSPLDNTAVAAAAVATTAAETSPVELTRGRSKKLKGLVDLNGRTLSLRQTLKIFKRSKTAASPVVGVPEEEEGEGGSPSPSGAVSSGSAGVGSFGWHKNRRPSVTTRGGKASSLPPKLSASMSSSATAAATASSSSPVSLSSFPHSRGFSSRPRVSRSPERTSSPRSVSHGGASSASPGMSRRNPLSPMMYERRDLYVCAKLIEDEESQRLSELAFMDC